MVSDEDLRLRLAAWARPLESAPPPPVEVIRGRARRRVARIAVTGTSVVVMAAIAVAVVMPALRGGSGPGPRPVAGQTGWRPPERLPGPDAGPASAPYFVMFDLSSDPPVPVLYTVSARQPTPRRIGAIRLPGHGMTPTDVVAAADDRSFLLTANVFRHGSLISRYYELRLSRDGRPTRLIPLRIGVLARSAGGIGTTALSPDGTELAIAAQAGSDAMIAVVTLASGRVRIWVEPGRAQALGPLSWVGGRLLAFGWRSRGARGPQIRVLDPAAVGDRLIASSGQLIASAVRFGRFTGLANAPITATSTAVFALMSAPLRPPYGPGSQMAVVQFSARTGRPERVITQSAQNGMGSFCGVLWADRSGRQVVTSCGYRLGSSSNGRFRLWSGHSFWLSLKYVPFGW